MFGLTRIIKIMPALVFIAIAITTWHMSHADIEADVKTRVLESSKEANADWAKIAVEGRDVILEGTAPGKDVFEETLRKINQIKGVRIVRSKTDILDVVSPYPLSLSKDGTSITLKGNVPNTQTKEALINEAKTIFSELNIQDNLELAAGAPDQSIFSKTSKQLIRSLSFLKHGAIEMSDLNITVTGEPINFENSEKLKTELGNLDNAVRVETSALTPPTVPIFKVSIKVAADNKITLSGEAPSEQALDRVIASVESYAPNKQVSNTLKLAKGEGEELYLQNVNYAASLLPNMSEGEITLYGDKLIVVATPKSVSAEKNLRQSLSIRPTSIASLNDDILPAKVEHYDLKLVSTPDRLSISGKISENLASILKSSTFQNTHFGKTVSLNADVVSAADTLFDENAKKVIELTKITDNINATLSGNELTIIASTEDFKEFETLKTATTKLSETLTLKKANINPPLTDSFVWDAQKQDNKIVASGLVPSKKFQNHILGKMTNMFEGVNFEDTTQIATGEDDQFLGRVDYAINLLAKLENGTIQVSGRNIEITGLAKSAIAYRNAVNLLKESNANNAIIKRSDLALPEQKPYIFKAEHWNGKVKISGFAPSITSSESILTHASELFPNLEIINHLSLASGTSEAQFQPAVTLALTQFAKLSSGFVIIQGSTIFIHGQAKDIDNYQLIEEALAAPAPKGYTYAAAEVKPAIVKPYIWHAIRKGGIVTLTGYVPSNAIRQQLVATAQELDVKVFDKMRIALPEDNEASWFITAKRGIKLLDKVFSGTVSMNNLDLSVVGTANSREDLLEINEDLKFLADGVKLMANHFTAPPVYPFTWRAKRTSSDIVIDGYVPNDDARKEIANLLDLRFLGEKITDNTLIAGGAPVTFVGAISVGLEQLSRLETGTVELSDLTVKVTGLALYEQAKEQIIQNMNNGLPPTYIGETALEVKQDSTQVSEAQCQTLLSDLVARGKILFETASAEIKRDSFGILDFIVFTLKKCGDADIMIEGHTDSVGGDQFNQILSERRALAVRTYLNEQGINTYRIGYKGYGETQPVAPNDTDENKAKNRRIEFKLK